MERVSHYPESSGKVQAAQGFPTHRRARTLSTFSVASNKSLKLRLDCPKSPPAHLTPLFAGPQSAKGSFSPTTSACASLRSFAQCSSSRERTVSLHVRPKSRPLPIWTSDLLLRTDSSMPGSPRSIESSSLSIPSISRTASSFSDRDDISTAPTSVHVSREPSPHRQRTKPMSMKLDPVLAACERGSKFSTRVVCATCSKPGRDYPKCGKCGEMWCSRTCRLKDGAKRHVCAS
ncbi:hypothetical protein FIBSPDRAFT_847518 [Athelia psychrophila]|uniref:Uncharacterized protein n=1 Tax=Athelia psychrophila TaxID=1759441 RepID=A0A166WC26_9AGAM|nr:hypothetical protein FIBSPDRAFT_847518 [Fibularhizoctonia sp. CBS 109695]